MPEAGRQTPRATESWKRTVAESRRRQPAGRRRWLPQSGGCRPRRAETRASPAAGPPPRRCPRLRHRCHPRGAPAAPEWDAAGVSPRVLSTDGRQEGCLWLLSVWNRHSTTGRPGPEHRGSLTTRTEPGHQWHRGFVVHCWRGLSSSPQRMPCALVMWLPHPRSRTCSPRHCHGWLRGGRRCQSLAAPAGYCCCCCCC